MDFRAAFVFAVGLFTLADAHAAGPTMTEQFRSASGQTVISYFAYDAGPCPSGCTLRDVIKVEPGADQTEVFLSGFSLQAEVSEDAVSHAAVEVQKHTYDPSNGALEFSVSASLTTRTAQPYRLSMTFVVVQASFKVAKFTRISTGCAGTTTCVIQRQLANAIPPGMSYIGLATQIWDLGSRLPLNLSTLSAHLDALTLSPPNVDLTYRCMMSDLRQSRKNQMYCEWQAMVVAFDPAEMEQNGSSIFPQFTYISTHTTTGAHFQDHMPSPSNRPITGVFDAFEGLSFSYNTFQNVPPGAQNSIWLIENTADGFAIAPGSNTVAIANRGIFLGSKFGDRGTGQPFLFQSSRAVGLLH